MWLGFSLMWVSVSAAVSVGIYVTHSPLCLWAFLFPALMRMTSGKDGRGEKGEEESCEAEI